MSEELATEFVAQVTYRTWQPISEREMSAALDAVVQADEFATAGIGWTLAMTGHGDPVPANEAETADADSPRVLPTGTCWCGCGQLTPRGSFFRPGHDLIAVRRVITERYGDAAHFLTHHGTGQHSDLARSPRA